MRSWRTRPGEPIRGIQPGSELVGRGTYEGRPQWVYRNVRYRVWYRVTMMSDRTYTVEEYTQAEMDQAPCMQSGCEE